MIKMDAYIFSGPTLSMEDMAIEGCIYKDHILELSNGKKIRFLPPVREGDIFRTSYKAPGIIGIIDGYFENTPSVWHKEILFAMSKGIHVLGASSMGAIRAAELSSFGMEGVGEIYESFYSGELNDDDEVAVSHAPEEVGYAPLSEAMVNIRKTLSLAIKKEVLTTREADIFIKVAKSLFYKDRNYLSIFEIASRMGISPDKRLNFHTWLTDHAQNPKRDDALLLVDEIVRRLQAPLHKKEVLYTFENTILWSTLRKKNGQSDAPL